MNLAHIVSAFALAVAIGMNFVPKTPSEWFLLIAVAVWLNVNAMPKGDP